jgi:hypothetical protein
MPRFAFRLEPPAAHVNDIPIAVRLPTAVRATTRYARNPVVLFQHAGEGIGALQSLQIADGKLRGVLRFANEPRRDRILRLVRGGLIKFAELDVTDDGELIEMSVVGPLSTDDELELVTDAADRRPLRVLRDGEVFTAADLACRIDREPALLFDSNPRKETTMSKMISAARERVAVRDRNQGLGKLAQTKDTKEPTFPSSRPSSRRTTHLDAKSPDLVAALEALIALSKREGIGLDELLSALRDLAELRASGANDPTLDAAHPVAAARRRVAARGLPPLAMSKE